MPGWERHTYRKWRTRMVVKEGSGSLKQSTEAEPVNPGPVAGFARPLPQKEVDIPEGTFPH